MRENNALHLEMIRCEEELEAKETLLGSQEKHFQEQIQELQFLNTQKNIQLNKHVSAYISRNLR